MWSGLSSRIQNLYKPRINVLACNSEPMLQVGVVSDRTVERPTVSALDVNFAAFKLSDLYFV